ncbi:ABC transporter ATP-binding protein [Bosea sp. (in: a-proteobacteria)]|uniref:ABC transporter ATP-binding protein n=1 Tax=Bosea sp. (in: a-proteobacteria) TaxID=1871050 RepID=UPI00263992C2|nr:ABC transporter ATP-binding protein [Bosea sp. (in: a-proteobacteria)]MCO5091311.1 ABC transporter ATP-binding protein [Bosea sp. (in: a-proteobacteria)]
MKNIANATGGNIEIKAVSKFYGEAQALRDVSIEIVDGRFLTLLGPSGSGKTTLLMSIAGFTVPSSGKILMNGVDITRRPPEARNFGMVFQGYALFPHLTVAENVAFSLKLRNVGSAELTRRVADALDMVQLGHLAGRYPRELSGGQQQRVALARALVFEPRVLLLDEPLSALDRRLRADLQWELKSLHSRLGVTFIYVTHDQDEALSMSDEIAILRGGRIIQHGTPRDLYDNPATRFVSGFLGRSNYIEGTFVERAGSFVLTPGNREFAIETSGQKPRPGENLTLAIRPERISVEMHEPADGANKLQARLSDVSYQGATTILKTQTDLGEFEVICPSWQSAVPLEKDRAVWLTWHPAAGGIVLADQDE